MAMPGAASPADQAIAVAMIRRRRPTNTHAEGGGCVCGCILALGASLSFAAARAGILNGLSPGDLILMRFAVAGVVLLPFLLAKPPAPRAAIALAKSQAYQDAADVPATLRAYATDLANYKAWCDDNSPSRVLIPAALPG